MNISIKNFLLILSFLVITACGGGGQSQTTTTDTVNENDFDIKASARERSFDDGKTILIEYSLEIINYPYTKSLHLNIYTDDKLIGSIYPYHKGLDIISLDSEGVHRVNTVIYNSNDKLNTVRFKLELQDNSELIADKTFDISNIEIAPFVLVPSGKKD